MCAPRSALATARRRWRIDDSQKSTAVLEKEPSGSTELTVVDEAGLRALIRAGQNPKAVQEFRRWVATELLLSLERMSMPPSVPGRTSEQRNPIHESGATTAEAPLWNGPLIPVFTATIGGIEHLVFNARDLHGFLGSRDKFADWIKDQFKRARLKEHRHYGVFRKIPKNSTKGGRPGVEHHLTMDAAKHIAMIANTDKAFEIRDYFIECERQVIESQRVRRAETERTGTPSMSPNDLWVYDGPPANQQLKIFDIPAIQGGYVMLLGLSSGGTMLCSANDTGTHVRDIQRRVGGFGLEVTRVLVSKPHMQYGLLKSELARELKDVPRINHTYPQANIEVLKKRAEAFLEKAYQRYAPRWEKPSEQMVGAKAKVVSALEELVEAIRAWQIG